MDLWRAVWGGGGIEGGFPIRHSTLAGGCREERVSAEAVHGPAARGRLFALPFPPTAA